MRKNFVLVFLLLVSNVNSLSAQVRQEWVRGGGSNAIALDAEGNVYVTGEAYVTTKYDGSGNRQWSARYIYGGGAAAIALDAEGNVHVTGSTQFGGTGYDYVTIKYDRNGKEQWVARYDGPGHGNDSATAIALDAEGNVYVTGSSCAPSGFPCVAGDYATIKYDGNGKEQWVARYHGPGIGFDQAIAIALDAEGNVYVTGRSVGEGTNWDYATIKYDGNGKEHWVARYHGPGNGSDYARAMALDAEGNVYVTGSSVRVIPGDYSYWDYATIKYNGNGKEQWVARYHGPVNDYDLATAIALDAEGNVYVTGRSSGDYATIKYDGNGNQQWVARYHGPVPLEDFAKAIAIDAEGNVYVTGDECIQTDIYKETIVCIGYGSATIKYSQE